MNASALLAELTRSGIRLEPRGDMLHVEAPTGADTPELRRTLTQHKTELLAMLKREPRPLPAGVACAYTRLGRTLAAHPDIRTAVEVVGPDADPVLMAIAVRGAGFVCMKTPREHYDGFQLLELLHRWNHKGSNPE